jgi:5-methylcytosine-specific restriction endonuclease McrA
MASRRLRDGIGLTGQYKRAKRGVDPLAIVRCFLCSEPLINIRTNMGRYPLHKACRQNAPTWVRRGQENPRRAEFQAKIDKAARGTSGGNRVFVSGGCAWCAETFTAAGGVYCSDKCKASASFKRRSGGKSFTVSPRVRAAIYERDSWTCQLCAYPVDGTLSHRDNWSASLDHIIPQSHMLIPDHSPSNLRLVHKMCNSLRGDGSNMTEAEFHRRVNVYFEGVAA